MNYALIFAGGTGVRMNTHSRPKQFLELHGKPIIIYTLEHFQHHPEVEGMVVVCLKEWVPELKKQIKRYELDKVIRVVQGGETGHQSINKGLEELNKCCKDADIILVHDGVRPLITAELISKNIAMAQKEGTAITVESSWESIVRSEDGKTITEVPDRSEMYIARAPQSFRFELLWDLHQRAKKEGKDFTDSSHLFRYYDVTLHLVESSPNNIKITEPNDYYIFRALFEVFENQQIIGG
ncbi:MAG: IspD/TarI family cytidylyltransferase [Eubacteriales bacterium]